MNSLSEENNIRTHYLKISRQASFQISLKPLDQEDFRVLNKNNRTLSLNQFLDNFNAPAVLRQDIASEIDVDLDRPLEGFFTCGVLDQLKENSSFRNFYEENRNEQKTAFNAYISSFGTSIKKNGMTVVDIGWGGTMQESLYQYFNREVAVTGLYLGLKEIYNITEDTKRYGLNFSIYPSTKFDDHVLKANGQLYEQLAAAPHGCTIGYSNDPKNPTVEFHEEREKYVYDNYVKEIQTYMRKEINTLSSSFKYVDYTKKMTQDYLVKLALKTGLFMNRPKLKFIQQISKGFFQNIGDNKVGLNYKSKALPLSKKNHFHYFALNTRKTLSLFCEN